MDQVLDVQERGALLPDVDEGGLHAREHAAHLAEDDVTEGALAAEPLNVELRDDALR